MGSTIETIGIIFVSCVVSSVVSVMLYQFKEHKTKFYLREVWGYVLPAFILSVVVMSAVLLVYGVINILMRFFIAII